MKKVQKAKQKRKVRGKKIEKIPLKYTQIVLGMSDKILDEMEAYLNKEGVKDEKASYLLVQRCLNLCLIRCIASQNKLKILELLNEVHAHLDQGDLNER